ncbi:hypothetical protein TNCV_264501 [Trichonephila clavipes]|nr:hypothetical protein TNCV_264501 [Trichonephila clavipes]
MRAKWGSYSDSGGLTQKIAGLSEPSFMQSSVIEETRLVEIHACPRLYAADFLHHENPPTWPAVEPTNVVIQDQRLDSRPGHQIWIKNKRE